MLAKKLADQLWVRCGSKEAKFSYLWLRDNDPAVRTRNGHRPYEISAIASVTPQQVQWEQDKLQVEWSDGHHSTFPQSWLFKSTTNPEAQHWDHTVQWSAHQFADLANDSSALEAALLCVKRSGFVIISGVPTERDNVLKVVDLFGHARVTNYGTTFDVKAVPDADHLAYTTVPLGLHTDNCYRQPVPTLQLLHCLQPAVQGGDTVLVDGIGAALQLRTQNPDAFDVLASTVLEFKYYSDTVALSAKRPTLQVLPDGTVVAIHLNHRSMHADHLDPEAASEFYKAYLAYWDIVNDPAMQCRLRLEQGDVCLWDNERLLHARTPYQDPERFLQGCYADRDSLYSTLGVLQGSNCAPSQ